MPEIEQRDGQKPAAPESRRCVPAGIAVYQDVILDGTTRAVGIRDCEARWRLIARHLSAPRTVLDLGSCFGWFGLQLCARFPGCVVASCEGDERTAAVQREVLDSNSARRICLLTRTATHGLFRRWRRRGQRLDAALLLSVLHWMPDHQSLLRELGAITARMFVECPHPRETKVGIPRVARAVSRTGEYLRHLFRERPVVCLGTVPGLPDSPYSRDVWMVGPRTGPPTTAASGLECSCLLAAKPAWPARSWWEAEFERLHQAGSELTGSRHLPETWEKNAAVWFTDRGLMTRQAVSARAARRVARGIARLPEASVPTTLRSYLRAARRKLFRE